MAQAREIIIELRAETSKFLAALREAARIAGAEFDQTLRGGRAPLAEFVSALRSALSALSAETSQEAQRIRQALREAFTTEVLSGVELSIDASLKRILQRMRILAEELKVNLGDAFREGVESIRLGELTQGLERLAQAGANTEQATSLLLKSFADLSSRLNALGLTSREVGDALALLSGSALRNIASSAGLTEKAIELLEQRLDELSRTARQYAAQALIVGARNAELAESIRQAYGETAVLIDRARMSILALRASSDSSADFTEKLFETSKAIRAVEGNIDEFARRYDFAAHQVQRSRLAVLAFTQIIQDLPFGLIAVANNIQQFSLAMTMLLSGGERLSATLKLLLRDLFSLRGFLLPFSVTVLTSVAVFWDRFSDAIARTIARLRGVREATLEATRAIKEASLELSPTFGAELIASLSARIDTLRALAQPSLSLQGRLAGAGVGLPPGFVDIDISALRAAQNLKTVEATLRSFIDTLARALANSTGAAAAFMRLGDAGGDLKNRLVELTNETEAFKETLRLVGNTFGEEAERTFRFTSSLLALADAAQQSSEAARQLKEIMRAIAPEDPERALSALRAFHETVQAAISEIDRAEREAAERMRAISSLIERAPEPLRPLIEAQRELIELETRLVSLNEARRLATEGTREARRITQEILEIETRLATQRRISQNELLRTLATSERELRRIETQTLALAEMRARLTIQERDRLERLLAYQERALGLEREIVLERARAAIAPSRREQEEALFRIRLLNAERRELEQLQAIEQTRLELLDRRRTLEINVGFAEATRNARLFAQATFDAVRAEVELIRQTEALSEEALGMLLETSLRRAAARVLEFYQLLSQKTPFETFTENLDEFARNAASRLDVESLTSRSLFLLTTLDQVRAFEHELRNSFRRAVEAVRRAPEADQRLLVQELARRFFPLEEAAEMSLEELEALFERRLRETVLEAVRKASPTSDRAAFEMRTRLLGLALSAQTAPQLEMVREELRRLMSTFQEVAARITEMAKETYGDAIPEAINRTTAALSRLAEEAQQLEARLARPEVSFFVGLDQFFSRLRDMRVLEAVNDITTTTITLTTEAMRRRREELIAAGVSEEEATRIVEREGRRRIQSMKQIARATIWIEGLAELAGISRSIAATVPWPASLALIALHTAATYARIRARLAALERLGSLSADAGTSVRPLDLGRVVQTNELTSQTATATALANAITAARESQENAIVRKLDELRTSVEKGLTVDEDVAARIIEKGASRFAYKQPSPL